MATPVGHLFKVWVVKCGIVTAVERLSQVCWTPNSTNSLSLVGGLQGLMTKAEVLA
jgi:hypothetical protein